jgi:hypothetical protein
MAAFSEIIAENFFSEVELTWETAGPKHIRAHFPVDQISVLVFFEERESPGIWYVSFEVAAARPEDTLYLSWHIFNGVFQAAEEFASVRQPDSVILVAKRDKLASIYETYLRREAARLQDIGYALMSVDKVDSFTEFVLRRFKASRWKDREGGL